MNTENIGPSSGAAFALRSVLAQFVSQRGRQKTMSAIADIGPERIVYVSCDPASLSRDLAYMQERGYKAVEGGYVSVDGAC